ncbi:spore coat protein [Virgibacillus doumboii]|uniref:spore coat protein n=1 Tax=Virgibacillus doumboii TaxID=2697503 RepID=UPI0013DF51D3|nr:spore coat protein [Virgibacillus doumboii]
MKYDRKSNTSHSHDRKNRYFYYKGRHKTDQHYCRDCNCKVKKNKTRCNACADNYETNNLVEVLYSDPEAAVSQDGGQYSFMDQESAEMIWVKESCNITIDSMDTQTGVSLQASLQLAIMLVLNIVVGDSERGEAVSQELMQHFNADQINRQKIFIYNTKDATVTTTDTDLAVNIQAMLQLLLALAVMIDVL